MVIKTPSLSNLKKFFRQAILCAVIATVAIVGTRITRPNYDPTITLEPLILNLEDPTQTKVGQFDFIAAWELTSVNPNFGGISALNILEDGRFLGVSDAGTLIGFGLKGNKKADRPFIAPLPGSLGKELTYKDRDSEAMAYDPNSGRFWVAYEFSHAIRRFTRSFARTDKLVHPPLMKEWGPNSGAEAIVRFKDGRFVIFSEGADLPDGSYEGVIFSGDPTEKGSIAKSFGYLPPNGYKVTDATLLPNGKLLMLHRRISFPEGFAIKIGILEPSKIIAGETISSETIATLSPPLLVDNFEGITISNENGKTIVWIISDNNFNIFQRTILMKLSLRQQTENNNIIKDIKPQEQDIKKPDIKPGFESL